MNDPDFSTSPPNAPGKRKAVDSDATAPRLAPSSTRSSAAAAIRQRAPSAGKSSCTRNRACARLPEYSPSRSRVCTSATITGGIAPSSIRLSSTTGRSA